MKSLAILGSTGSIGENSLKVYEKNKINFDLIFLAAHKNLKKLLKQKKKYNPKKIFKSSLFNVVDVGFNSLFLKANTNNCVKMTRLNLTKRV